jgi:outer membrane protein assembly factor BamB
VLTDPDTFPLERVGWSIASNEDRIAVGAPFTGTSTGNVLVFDRHTGNLLQRLRPSGPQSNNVWGTDLDIDGNRLIIGSWYGNAAYVFDINTGQQLRSLSVPGSENFGFSVAIKGNTAVIGDISDSANGYLAGAAYIMDVTTGDVLSTLRGSDGDYYQGFGNDVAIDENYALIGSSATSSVHQYDLATGMLIRKLRGTDTRRSDGFGNQIAVDNGRVLVSAPNKPAVYLFDLTTGAELRKLQVPGVTHADEFRTIDLNGDLALVGARDSKVGDVFDAGIAYLFRISSGDLLAKLQLSDPQFNTVFGHAVWLDGTTAFVSAPGLNEYRGAVFVFEIPEPPATTFGVIGTFLLILSQCPRAWRAQ